MNTVSPYCKVWKASPALLSAIRSIPIKDIPKHRDNPFGIAEQVDTTRRMGYVECMTCEAVGAHNDWNEVFGLVCLSGRGEFIIGEPDGHIWGQNFADAKEVKDMKNAVRFPIRKGTCLQFWGASPHALEKATRCTFAVVKGYEENVMEFFSEEDFDKKALELLKNR